MKHILATLCLLLLAAATLSAQAPNLLPWQGAFRDKNDQPQNGTLQLRFRILQGSAAGTEVFEETNPNVPLTQGVASHVIGSVDTVGLAALDWSNGPYFLEVARSKGGTYEVVGTPEQLKSVPYALYAESSGERYVGSFPLQGDAYGAVVIAGSTWQQVTRTTYTDIESMFHDIAPPTLGMVREYYLAIQVADNIDACAEHSEWRFWFTWEGGTGARGHQFTVARNWGNLGDGSIRRIKIPSSDKQRQDLNYSNSYFRLEARIPSDCPDKQMRVYAVSVFAVDRPSGAQPTTVATSLNTPGVAVPTQIGPGGQLRFEPNGNNTLFGLLDLKGALVVDVSNFSGVGGRDALYLRASPDNDAAVIVANKPEILLFSSSADNRANLTCGIVYHTGLVNQSDRRIKNVVGVSDSRRDLSILNKIEITDYFFKDPSKGDTPQKRVIGQQVAAVFPQAVSKCKDVVPDILQTAAADKGWVRLQGHGLKPGDKVQLRFGEKTEILEVTEATADGFRVASDKSGEVFVYGREVPDFHAVDYDAIAMLNVSATQELSKKVESLEKQLAERDARLAAAMTLLQTLQQDVAALKNGQLSGAGNRAGEK